MQAQGVLQRARAAARPRQQSPTAAACSTSYGSLPSRPTSPQRLQTRRQQQQRRRWRAAAAGGDEEGAPAPPAPAAPRDDDVLPDSLTGALRDASAATCLALDNGVERCVVRAAAAAVGRGRGGGAAPASLQPKFISLEPRPPR